VSLRAVSTSWNARSSRCHRHTDVAMRILAISA
jgi:hypothetical protein